MIQVNGQDYLQWLKQALVDCEQSVFGESVYDFRVYEDRDFEKTKGKFKLEPNVIPIIVRTEEAVTQFTVKITPISIYFLTEENDIDVKQVFEAFAQTYNLYRVYEADKTQSTHNYTAPMVTSAFTNVLAGYRAVYVIGGSIATATNVADIDSLTFKIGTESENLLAKLISFSMTYASTMNTEMIGTNEIGISKQSASTCAMAIEIPCTDGLLVNKCLDQMLGDVSGDTAYLFSFSINGKSKSDIPFKLQSFNFTKSAGEIPNIAMSFVR